jgi:hypothetical protein
MAYSQKKKDRRIWSHTSVDKEGKKDLSLYSYDSSRKGLDKKRQIALATVSKALDETQAKMLSMSELENTIGGIAASNGANGELLAALLRTVPVLCRDIETATLETDVANILISAKAQYRIWMDGTSHIVDNISGWFQKKENYLLWLDLDEKNHASTRSSGSQIGPKAIQLLIYLVERIGQRVSFEELLKEIWNEEIDEEACYRGLQENKVDQQLRALQNFCAGQFRKYLFPEKFSKGIGLIRSFSDKYFIFTRLR